MSLPEEILENLLCSNCGKYLSVQPVKVYPDRTVKCGRCHVNADDGGVESPLYSAIVGNLKFPCINRYEGCDELLSWPEDIGEHEQECQSRNFNCRACSIFQGSGYDLFRHIRKRHRDQILTNQEFLLELDKGSQINTYYYMAHNLLLCILCQFDATTDQLFLDISTIQRKEKVSLKQQFFIHSIDGSLSCKSAALDCSDYSGIQGEGHLFYISSEEFLKSIMLIKFNIKQDTVLYLEKNPILVSDARSCSTTWRYTFSNISKINVGQKCDSTIFYVSSMPWKLTIYNISNNRPNAVNIYLALLQEKNCKVDISTKVLPSDSSIPIKHSRSLELIFGKNAFARYRRLIFTAGDVLNSLGNAAAIDDYLTVEIDIKVDVKNTAFNEINGSCSNNNHIDKKIKLEKSE